MIVPTRAQQMGTAFVMGVFFHIGMTMAYQDWKGLEGYIAIVEQNWWDLHWGVGAVIAAAAVARYYYTLRVYDRLIDMEVEG